VRIVEGFIEVSRETLETRVRVRVRLRGTGKFEIRTTIPFLDHMLKTLALHSLMDLYIDAEGDLHHHIAEDVAITLGQAIGRALGKREGLRRFGYAKVPMDESLAEAAVDLISRPFAVVNLNLSAGSIEGFDAKLLVHFIRSFACSIPATVHVNVIYGEDDHHKAEAAFKALALALRDAWSKVNFPTTVKGVY